MCGDWKRGREGGRSWRGVEKKLGNRIILLFIHSECGFCTIYTSELGDHLKLFTRRQNFCTKFIWTVTQTLYRWWIAGTLKQESNKDPISCKWLVEWGDFFLQFLLKPSFICPNRLVMVEWVQNHKFHPYILTILDLGSTITDIFMSLADIIFLFIMVLHMLLFPSHFQKGGLCHVIASYKV